MATLDVSPPPVSQSALRTALMSLNPGDTAVLHGSWGAQYINSFDRGGEITVKMAPDATLGTLTFVGAKNLTFDGVRCGAVDFKDVQCVNVKFLRSTIDAGGVSARAVRLVMPNGTAQSLWHDGIVIDQSEIKGSIGDDLVSIFRARNLTITNNLIHNAIIPPGTTTHVDGIQATHLIGATITGNQICYDPVPSVPAGSPFQGIILSTKDTSDGEVANVVMANNTAGRKPTDPATCGLPGAAIVVCGNVHDVDIHSCDIANAPGGFFATNADGTPMDLAKQRVQVWALTYSAA